MAHFDAEFVTMFIDKADGRAGQAAAGNHMVARLQEAVKTPPESRTTGRSGDR